MEQLIIPPLETVSKALEYLNRMSAFYDTKFRYFLDYDTGYLLSCRTRFNGRRMGKDP